MKSTSPRLAALLFCAAAISLGGLRQAGAQDPEPPADAKYTFKNTSAVGDVRVIDNVLDTNFDVTFEANGQQFSFGMVNRGRQAYREEVLAVKNGSPIAVKRTYSAARVTNVGIDGKQTTKVYSYQGKTVTLRRTGTKIVVTAAKGKLAPADIKELKAEFQPSESNFTYPKQPLAPGDPWPVDRSLLKKLMPSPQTKGEIKGVFEGVEERNGRTLARIRFDIQVTGKPGGSPIPITAVGNMVGYYDLSIGRELGMEMSLPMSAEGDFEQQGRQIHASGSGTMSVKQTVKWAKVAGKPPVPAKPMVETPSGT